MSNPKTILIVDDSAVVRSCIKFTLSGAGFEVVEARDGKEGLEALGRLQGAGCRPAMIISDINMPVMDGITFITQAKAAAARFIPILVLTTESEAAKKAEGKNAGAAGWLVKPFNDEQLLTVVKKLVRI